MCHNFSCVWVVGLVPSPLWLFASRGEYSGLEREWHRHEKKEGWGKKNSKITWITLSSKKSGWWSWTLDWITLKDRYLRQLLRKSLLRPSSLIFKCSLYWINCLKHKEDFLMNVWSNRNVTAKNFIRKFNFLSFHFILKQRRVMRKWNPSSFHFYKVIN